MCYLLYVCNVWVKIVSTPILVNDMKNMKTFVCVFVFVGSTIHIVMYI